MRTEARLVHEIEQLERQSKLSRAWSGVGNEQNYEFASHARTNGTRTYMKHAKRTDKRFKSDIEEKKILLRNMEQVKDLDIYQDTIEEFHTLSKCTYGEAGKYTISQLAVIKKRVEDGLLFLCNMVI